MILRPEIGCASKKPYVCCEHDFSIFLDIFARKSLAFFWGAKNLIVEISQTGF